MRTSSRSVTDVVFTRPSSRPFEAMPVGTGDLTAMVRVGAAIELHLGKCDSWGFRDWHNRIHDCELLSPGHVTIHFSPDPVVCDQLGSFEQRLSPQRGLIEATIKTNSGDITISVWGEVQSNVLVVEVDDQRTTRAAPEVELSHWRNEPSCQVAGECIISEEVQAEAVLPDCRPGEVDPYQGRGIGIAVGCDAAVETRWWGRENASLILPAGIAHYRVLIACETACATTAFVAEDKSAVYYRGGVWNGQPGSAAGRALRTLSKALALPPQELRRRHAAWWAEFWQRSSVDIQGDSDADTLTRLWHLFHYQMAISSRGAYPTKFNGGPGIYERDVRAWLLEAVWQNDREHLWPLDAANHADLADNVWRMYTDMLPYLRRLTRETWGISGVWLNETHEPWWDRVGGDPAPATYVTTGGGLQRDLPGSYCSHIFSSGPELVQQMLDHARHTGDANFLRSVAYPWLAGVCEFYANWACTGDDGLYHFFPSNANETWWKVKDTLNDLCAVRVLFPEFIALSTRYGEDTQLAAHCREILARLPDLPLGAWRWTPGQNDQQVDIDRAADVYSPASTPLADRKKHNMENPECYIIFPWSLTGLGAADWQRAVRTFETRACPNLAGWSQCGVQAARLGLREQTAAIILDHARRHQTHPFGGWNSPGSMPYRLEDGTRLCDCPYLDAAGENATAIQEMLMQSYPPWTATLQGRLRSAGDASAGRGGNVAYGDMHGGVIRFCPAVPGRWRGSFTLHAMGGFLVSCEFAAGVPTSVVITSERGNTCTVANPWQGEALLACRGKHDNLGRAPLLTFSTEAGETYTLAPAA